MNLIQSGFCFLLHILFLFRPTEATLRKSYTDDNRKSSEFAKLLISMPHQVRRLTIKEPDSGIEFIAKQNITSTTLDYLLEESAIFSVDSIDNKHENTILVRTLNRTINLLSPSKSFVKSLSVDWVTQKVYWSNTKEERIEVIDLRKPDIHHRKVLIWKNLKEVDTILVDPINRYLYWMRRTSIFLIEKAGLDGSDRKVIFQDPEDPDSTNKGLALDYESGRIYWIDSYRNVVVSVTFEGQNKLVLKLNSDRLRNSPMDLTIFEDKIYFSQHLSIRWISKSRNSTVTTIKTFKSLLPLALRTWHRSKQPPASINPCRVKNGGCSNLCLLTPSPPYFACACSTGIRLNKDARSCPPLPEAMLFVAHRRGIYRVSLDAPDYTFVTVLRLTETGPKAGNPVRLDFDPVERRVYWVDDILRTINRVDLDGKNIQEVFRMREGKPEGISVDWIARNLYWSVAETRQIWISRLNGNWPRMLLSEGSNRPQLPPRVPGPLDDSGISGGRRGGGVQRIMMNGRQRQVSGDAVTLVVDPINRRLFWNLRGFGQARLETGWLDGSHDRVLVESSHNMTWPNGLAVDFSRKQLYFAEARHKWIARVPYDGGNVTTVVTKGLYHPFGFSFLDDYVYWTDWDNLRISRSHINGSGLSTLHPKPVTDLLMGIKAVRLVDYPKGADNPCAVDNGGCSHLCFARPAPHFGHSCGCPSNQEVGEGGRICHIPDWVLVYSTASYITRIGLSRDGLAAKPGLSKDSSKSPQISSLDDLNRLPLNSLEQIFKLDFNFVEERVYWFDFGRKNIGRSFLNGSSQEVLVSSGLDSVESLAVDWFTNNLYIINMDTDNSWSRIELFGVPLAERKSSTDSPLPPLPRRVIIAEKLSSPKGLVLHPAKNLMFWFNNYRDNSYKLMSAALDGSEVKTLVHETGLIVDATIDYSEENGRLYWINSKTGTIETYLLDKGLDYSLKLSPSIGELSSLEVFKDYLYFSKTTTTSIYRISKRPPKDTTKMQETQIIPAESSQPTALFIFHGDRQPAPPPPSLACLKPSTGHSLGSDSSPLNRAVCQDLCLVREVGRGFSCACSTHFKLRKDQSTCQPPDMFLILIQEDGKLIRVLPDHTPPDVILPLRPFSLEHASDGSSGGDPQFLFHSGYSKPVRVVQTAAWEPLRNRGFYFLPPNSSDVAFFDVHSGKQTMFPSKDSPGRTPLSNQERHIARTPVSLAYEPVTGVLFKTDPVRAVITAIRTTKNPLHRDIGIVVNCSLPGKTLYRPLSLTIDPLSGHLFWISAVWDTRRLLWHSYRIEMSRLDGKERRTLVEPGALKRPAGLALDMWTGHLYWIDQSRQRIEKISVANGGQDHTVVVSEGVKPHANSLTVLGRELFWFDDSTQLMRVSLKETGKVPQAQRVHGVGHATLPLAAMVPVYLETSLKNSYLGQPRIRNPCADQSIRCSHLCIPTLSPGLPLASRAALPSSAQDQPPHPLSSFRCGCPMSLELGLDSPRDCRQRLCDVATSRCRDRQGYHQVSPGDCIPSDMRCNGFRDCDNGEDEADCTSDVCSAKRQMYLCGDGTCIDVRLRCDNVQHCNSDESCCASHQFKCQLPTGKTTCQSITQSSKISCTQRWYNLRSSRRNLPTVKVGGQPNYRVNNMPRLITMDTQSRATYTVAIVIAVLAVIVTFGVAGYTCTKRRHRHLLPPYVMRADQVDIMLVPRTPGCGTTGGCNSDNDNGGPDGVGGPPSSHCSPPSSSSRNLFFHPVQHHNHRHQGSRHSAASSQQQHPGDKSRRSYSPYYDRTQITGASSSNSAPIWPLPAPQLLDSGYPQETLNPPPSPITEVSYGGGQPPQSLDLSSWWYAAGDDDYGGGAGVSRLPFHATSSPGSSRKGGEGGKAQYGRQQRSRRHKQSSRNQRRYKKVRLLIYTTDPPPPTPRSTAYLSSEDDWDYQYSSPGPLPTPPHLNQDAIYFSSTCPPPPPPPPSSVRTSGSSAVYAQWRHHQHRNSGGHHHHHHGGSGRHHSRRSNQDPTRTLMSASSGPSTGAGKPLPPPPSPENYSD